MKFPYNKFSQHDRSDSLPRLPLRLIRGVHSVEALGLVDSGALVNVPPFDVGVQLGASWDDSRAIIRLAGNLAAQPAMPLKCTAKIEGLPGVELAFAWSKLPNAPLILGQMNFFQEFDVCFFRRQFTFEISRPD